jgi:hypothetical protein
VALNFEHLTLGELAEVEDRAGVSVTSLDDPTAPKIKAMIALAYVIKRREDRAFTYGQAEALTMADLNGIIAGDDDPKE